MMFKKNINNIISKIRRVNCEDQYLEIKKIHSKDDLIEFKNLNLKRLLLHSSKHVPYYRRLLKNGGVVNDKTVELSNFDKIPILTKEIMHTEELISPFMPQTAASIRHQFGEKEVKKGKPLFPRILKS